MNQSPDSRAIAPAGQATSRRPAERTCVVCRAVRDKRALVRVYRLPDGSAAVDPTGKGPGRGAYLCRRRACWLDAGLGRRLAHALKAAPADIDAAALRAFADGLPEEAAADKAVGDRRP